jgi:hypothetical protein
VKLQNTMIHSILYNKCKYIALSVFLGLCGAILIGGCKRKPGQVTKTSKRAPIELTAGVDKAVATTEDIITYTLTVDSLPDVVLHLPEQGAEIAGFRIIDMGQEGPKESEGRLITQKWYKLQADIVGSYIIPPVKLNYKLKTDGEQKEIQTSQIFVEVKSSASASDHQKDIIDIKPIEAPKTDYLYRAFLIGGGLLICVLCVLGIIYYRKRKRGDKSVIRPPAHEVALAELNKLKKIKYNNIEEIKKVYFALSEIFRRYMEERYDFPATDWTAEEIIAWTNQCRDLTFELKAQSRSFLINTDIVKFAKTLPGEEQINEELNRAICFVEATKPEPGMVEPETMADGQVTDEETHSDAVSG